MYKINQLQHCLFSVDFTDTDGRNEVCLVKHAPFLVKTRATLIVNLRRSGRTNSEELSQLGIILSFREIPKCLNHRNSACRDFNCFSFVKNSVWENCSLEGFIQLRSSFRIEPWSEGDAEHFRPWNNRSTFTPSSLAFNSTDLGSISTATPAISRGFSALAAFGLLIWSNKKEQTH